MCPHSSGGRRISAHGDPPTYLTFGGLAALGLPHAATTRHCPGVSSPSATGAPLGPEAAGTLAPAGLDISALAYARQVHGAQAAGVPANGGFAGAADILVTTARGPALAIFTADCLAITLYDPEAPALAVAHVGWRGTARSAALAAVSALVSVGARAERLHVAIAPSIGPCCYEVDAPVTAALSRAHPDRWERWVTPGRPGHVMLDLWRANEDLLERAGVDPACIENARLCTACHPELLFSYRKGHRGRLVTIATLP